MQRFAHQEMKGRGSVIGYEPSLFTTAVLNINTSCLNSDDFQVNIYAKVVTKEGGEERTSGLTRLTWRLTRQTRLTWRLTRLTWFHRSDAQVVNIGSETGSSKSNMHM